MNPNHPPPDERRDELLADRALQGLDPREAAELRRLLDGLVDESLDLAAAAADLALAGEPSEPLPEALRRAIEADAPGRVGPPPEITPHPRSRIAGRTLPWLGWAAAAALAFAFLRGGTTPIAPEPGPRPAPQPTLQERLADAARARLAPSDHPLAREAGGEVVWDAARQQGYLALEGLAGVDPRQGAYQLWIFDASRDPRYPVDGGLFTLSEGQTSAVVPIRAAVPVREPTLFAVTLEPPGGVVVSDRKRIMLTAAWPETGGTIR
ncbi:anti-sigma factor [Paludisphaera soli]|uniref:anti-sigma factor n=1 Tax=Paludisphaera soli TaxID=2712865 RepID=UPI0013EC5490|nr:anti-sigma factor [Paludisphaera soli]